MQSEHAYGEEVFGSADFKEYAFKQRGILQNHAGWLDVFGTDRGSVSEAFLTYCHGVDLAKTLIL
jgi:hypothetical protein